ncbi:hypothetical protein GN956_G3629 [Arapaima gigas]
MGFQMLQGKFSPSSGSCSLTQPDPDTVNCFRSFQHFALPRLPPPAPVSPSGSAGQSSSPLELALSCS